MYQIKIPFINLTKQYLQIKKEIDKAIKKVLQNQQFILGEELRRFEHGLAAYLGCKYSVGVGSGTEALILSLRVLGIGKDDEVITPVYSFIATTIAITEVGAKPIFIDIDPDTYQIDINKIEEKITNKTKAILPVHIYGAPCNIDQIKKIADYYNLYLIEDSAQAIGAKFKNRKLGTFGILNCFSFYPTKNLGAYGDGGAICTNNYTLYQELRRIRNYGQVKKYHHNILGVNSRLDEIQASVLRIKLKYLDDWNKKRRAIAKLYLRELNNLNIKTQTIIKGGISNYHLFVMEHPKRSQLQKYLTAKGIQTLIHYPIPIHLQKCYRYLGYKKGDFPVAEKLAKKLISLPMYPELTKSQIE